MNQENIEKKAIDDLANNEVLNEALKGGIQSKTLEKLLIVNEEDSEETKLLKEWFYWYMTDDEVPARTPDALHMRTLVRLMESKYGKKDANVNSGN